MRLFRDRPLCYVAGPYQFPDPVENTHNAIAWADQLNDTGILAAYPPHLSLQWHIVKPHSDPDYWYELDIAYLARFDVLFRIDGKSSGADNEIDYAKDNNIPVFYELTYDDMLAWAHKWCKEHDLDQQSF